MPKKPFILLLFYLFLAAGYVSAAIFPIEVPLGIPLSLPHYIQYFFWLAMAVGGIMAVLSLVISGARLIFAAGDPTKISDAKNQATSAILGLILLLSSFVLITTINPDLRNLQPKEDLRSTGNFYFVRGPKGPSVNPLSGCGIDECLGTTDGVNYTCSTENCGGYDGCQEGNTCFSSYSGCPQGSCRGTDGRCNAQNCNRAVYEKPAPLSMENLDVIKQDYGRIEWRRAITDLTGNQISNCEYGNPNFIHVIYWYKDYNFKNLYEVTRMRCGQYKNFAADLPEAKSYRIKKEPPGVYFYDGPNCFPKIGSENIPESHTQSIPEDIGMNGTVHSIRIVNGPDQRKGPFYGVVYFNSTDYRTGERGFGFQHFMFNANLSQEQVYDNNSRCFSGGKIGYGSLGNLPSKGVSWAIYQWTGFAESGALNNPGDGITLYSEVSWGKDKIPGANNLNPISATSWTSWIQVDLRTIPINYPSGATAQKARKNQCRFFNPYYSCLKSFQIHGNYLALVLSRPDIPYTYSQTTKAQIFPVSSRITAAYKDRPDDFSRERGTPELQTDYITSKSAYFMEIIPLAERLK